MYLEIPTYQDIHKVVQYPKHPYTQGYPHLHHRYMHAYKGPGGPPTLLMAYILLVFGSACGMFGLCG